MRDDRKTKAQLIKELREARRRLGRGEQAVASVGESEAKFRAVFEHSSIGKSLTSPDGRLIEVNPAFAAMLGYTVEEMSTLNFATVTHPDDVPECHECLRCLLAGERSTYRMEKRYIHRNSSIVWTLVNTSLLRDEAGAPRFFVTNIQDNTDRKRAEEAFRDANERLESRVLERTAELARSKELLDESGRLARVGGCGYNVVGCGDNGVLIQFTVIRRVVILPQAEPPFVSDAVVKHVDDVLLLLRRGYTRDACMTLELPAPDPREQGSIRLRLAYSVVRYLLQRRPTRVGAVVVGVNREYAVRGNRAGDR